MKLNENERERSRTTCRLIEFRGLFTESTLQKRSNNVPFKQRCLVIYQRCSSLYQRCSSRYERCSRFYFFLLRDFSVYHFNCSLYHLLSIRSK